MLARYLKAYGAAASRHTVISLMPNGPIAEELSAIGIPVFDLQLPQGRPSLRSLRKLRRWIGAEAPDVVFGWMYHGCLAALSACAGRSKTALIWGIHHSLNDLHSEKRSTRILLRGLAAFSYRVDGLTYCSDSSRRQHESFGFSSDRATVIPNAVDAETFRPDPSARARLGKLCGIAEGREIVGNVARSHPMKDHVSMVRAVRRLIADGRDVHAVLIGHDQPGGAAEAEAAKLGIRDRVSCLDGRSDVEALVPGFDVFLLSSAWGEAFPVAVTEAMACGVPCVATDLGDCAELIGTTGSIVPPRDVDAMARALHHWLDLSPPARLIAGNAARSRVIEQFSFDRYTEAHDALYADAIRHRRSGGTDNTAGRPCSVTKPRDGGIGTSWRKAEQNERP